MAHAGNISTWRFHYSTALSLPKGTRLKFDLLTNGRDIDWEIPTTHLEEGANVIYATLENGDLLEAREVQTPGSIAPQYEFILPSQVKVGGKITIVIGAEPGSSEADEELGNFPRILHLIVLSAWPDPPRQVGHSQFSGKVPREPFLSIRCLYYF